MISAAMRVVTLLAAVAVALPTIAQQSSSYVVDEHVINQGGAPVAGTVPASAGYSVTQLSIGEAIAGVRIAGATYTVDAGFGVAWLDPAEIGNLGFSDSTTLFWDADLAALHYRLHRTPLDDLGIETGNTCLQPTVEIPTTTDSDLPVAGGAFAYLIVGVNRFNAEGPKGAGSDGDPRAYFVCP